MRHLSDIANQFPLRDFGTAFCLVVSGHSIVSIRPYGTHHVEFIFEDSPRVREIARRYISGELTLHELPDIPVVETYEILKNLKRRVHARKNLEEDRA